MQHHVIVHLHHHHITICDLDVVVHALLAGAGSGA